jgi:hypothetical protein
MLRGRGCRISLPRRDRTSRRRNKHSHPSVCDEELESSLPVQDPQNAWSVNYERTHEHIPPRHHPTNRDTRRSPSDPTFRSGHADPPAHRAYRWSNIGAYGVPQTGRRPTRSFPQHAGRVHLHRRRGSVNLSRLRRKDGRKKRPSERVGRILGDFGEFAPGNESRRELFAIE